MKELTLSKLENLKTIIKNTGGAVVAFSGGVDSTFLLKVAHDVLGDKVLAVTANSETYPKRELEEAKAFAESLGIRHIVIETLELEIAGFADNPPDRCFYCKHELFSKLTEIAKANGIEYVFDGSNYDDRNDHRPGMRAAKELGVVSPLKQAEMTKDDIREASKEFGLSTWNKPSFACLSSRFPYGTKITQEKLSVIGEAEDFIRDLGFKELRVRHHDNIARIEIGKADLERIIAYADQIVEKVKSLGFLYVTLDLAGYKTGSMNYTLSEDEKSVESK
ncbi:MAG TPA: ATP-dependent sacrificial sulfur transferase LarE [Patescibacteria group bacterium]|nr:ATP-dependent sacrificial sulfur transferase LarE [Patescibacteria group bacterium]